MEGTVDVDGEDIALTDPLWIATQELRQGVEAYTRALAATTLDERLRCIHNGRQHGQRAHELILEWRQAPQRGNTT